ncbi:MAG: TonB-dependent receptor [Pseudomonadota bacterium]
MKEIVRRALAMALALVLLVALPAHAQDEPADPLDALLATSEPEQPAPENGTPAQTEPAPPAPLETIPVQSEAAPPEPPKPEQRKVPRGLEEIIVTATKREANPRDLPASITALSGEQMESQGYQGQEDFLKLVPGVTFSNDTINANRVTIRGIGADLNTSNTTGVFLGDVPFEDPTLPRVTLDPNPFDLARIEVLKGPQGTLFGGSALNGAVRYVPQDPRLDTWEEKAFVQMESVKEGDAGLIYGAAVNVPLGQTAALRLMAFDRRSPGWVDDTSRDLNDVNEVKQKGARLMGLWQPSEAWKISTLAVIQKTDVADSSITDNTVGRLSRSNTPQPSPVRTRYDLESLGIQYSFDTFDVQSQTSRAAKTFDASIDASRIGNPPDPTPPSVTIINDNESEALMQELRFTSNDSFSERWSWLGGAFFRRIHTEDITDILGSNQMLPIPAPVLAGAAGVIPGFGGFITEDGRINTARGAADPIDVDEAALFGEATVTFWKSLDVTLGLRVFQTVSDSVVRFSGALVTSPDNVTTGQIEKVSAGKLKERGVNPKLAVKYEFNDNLSVYSSVARGFRFGGAQVLVGTLTSEAPAFYQSDVIWSYELGVRTQWMDNTLTADVTAFYLDWNKPQLQQADASGLGAFFDNVGGARGQGLEMAVRYLTPLPGLTVSLSGAYVDTVTTTPFTTSSGVETQPGTRWPLAARWQSSTTLAYQRQLFGSWQGGATLLYSTISSAPNTLSYLDTVFGYETLDATLSLSGGESRGRPELTLSLANLTDTRGIISGVNNPQFAKDHNYIRPRTLVARIGFTF